MPATAIELPAAVQRALTLAAEADPAAAANAMFSMERFLERSTLAHSVLSPEGFPVEIAFSSADAALRYTADPGGDPADAVDRVASQMTALGAPPLPRELHGCIGRLQERGTLRFGAFAGARHQASASRYKIYCEVPPEQAAAAEALAEELMASPGVLPHRAQRIEMFALDADRAEFYARIESMTTDEAAVLFGRAGMRDRYPEIAAVLQRHYPFSIKRALPGSVFGYSYALPLGGGAPVACTLYTYARTMFGWDAKIRATLLELAKELCWDLSFYERLSEPLAHKDGALTSHTMFGVTAAIDRPLSVNFGVVPP